MRHILTISSIFFIQLLVTGCGSLDPQDAPTKDTPDGAKVDLTGVSLSVNDASIVKISDTKHELRFSYTLENTSGFNIQFPSIYANLNRLIDVTLTDKEEVSITLEKPSLHGLTLAQPSPRRIPVGKTTLPYSVSIAPNTIKQDDLVNLSVRMHVPSRYDELRSSLEAPAISLTWPGEPKKKKP